MGLEAVIAVLGIVIATAVSIWVYQKSHPRRALRYRVETTALLATSPAAQGRVRVSIDDRTVTDPHVLTLTLWSNGRADIGSQSFDAGMPLVFTVGATVLEEIPGEPLEQPHLEIQSPHEIVLRPMLLHRSFQSRIQIITDGAPSVAVNYVLADIPVIADGLSDTTRAIESSRKKMRITPMTIGGLGLVLGVLLTVVASIIFPIDREAYLPWGVAGVLIAIISIVSVIVMAMTRFIRWIGKNIEASSGLRR